MRAPQRTVPLSLSLESGTAGQSSEKRDTERDSMRDSRPKVSQLWAFFEACIGTVGGTEAGTGCPRGWDTAP